MIEYEAKILNVDPLDVEQRVLAAGGYLTEPRRLMRRRVYDIAVDDPTRWIRLRDNGSTVTLATKHIRHDGAIDGTDEVEIVVDDFEKAHQLLVMQGFTAKASQENYRTSYMIEGAAVEVDVWPLLAAPYAEIEGASREDVVRTAKLLGYREDELTAIGTTEIYARAGIDLTSIPVLRFDGHA